MNMNVWILLEKVQHAARDQVLLFSTAQHTTVVHIADENVTAKVLPQQKHNTTIHNKNLKTNIQMKSKMEHRGGGYTMQRQLDAGDTPRSAPRQRGCHAGHRPTGLEAGRREACVRSPPF